MKKLALQFTKYFAVAGIGYVIDVGAMVFCREVLQLHYLVSATVGFILGLATVYVLSSRYVFGESKLSSRRHELILFTLIGLVGLGILNMLMWAMTDGLEIEYILSKIFASVVVYAWNFFARRLIYHN
jgi:putative flippase GtrA